MSFVVLLLSLLCSLFSSFVLFWRRVFMLRTKNGSDGWICVVGHHRSLFIGFVYFYSSLSVQLCVCTFFLRFIFIFSINNQLLYVSLDTLLLRASVSMLLVYACVKGEESRRWVCSYERIGTMCYMHKGDRLNTKILSASSVDLRIRRNEENKQGNVLCPFGAMNHEHFTIPLNLVYVACAPVLHDRSSRRFVLDPVQHGLWLKNFFSSFCMNFFDHVRLNCHIWHLTWEIGVSTCKWSATNHPWNIKRIKRTLTFSGINRISRSRHFLYTRLTMIAWFDGSAIASCSDNSNKMHVS